MISIIVATARQGAIGRGGDQPFFISEDLRRFKQLTMGHPIIMGRKTFEALPRGPLPGRRNIVVSRDASLSIPGAEVANSIEQAIALAGDDDAFVIGGGRIYAQAFPLADRLIVTEIDADVPDADTFFPDIDPAEWRIAEATPWAHDPKNNLRYRYLTYDRK